MCSFPSKMDVTHAWENNALGYSILLGMMNTYMYVCTFKELSGWLNLLKTRIYALRIHIYIYIQLLKLEVLEKKTCLGP